MCVGRGVGVGVVASGLLGTWPRVGLGITGGGFGLTGGFTLSASCDNDEVLWTGAGWLTGGGFGFIGGFSFNGGLALTMSVSSLTFSGVDLDTACSAVLWDGCC